MGRGRGALNHARKKDFTADSVADQTQKKGKKSLTELNSEDRFKGIDRNKSARQKTEGGGSLEKKQHAI